MLSIVKTAAWTAGAIHVAGRLFTESLPLRLPCAVIVARGTLGFHRGLFT